MEMLEMQRLEAALEAILFTMGESVEASRLAAALEVTVEDIRRLVLDMQERYQREMRGIQITELEDSYQLCTRPEYYEYLIRIAKQPKRHMLTDVLLETLSIIAYKQPITKVEIEKIRGFPAIMR